MKLSIFLFYLLLASSPCLGAFRFIESIVIQRSDLKEIPSKKKDAGYSIGAGFALSWEVINHLKVEVGGIYIPKNFTFMNESVTWASIQTPLIIRYQFFEYFSAGLGVSRNLRLGETSDEALMNWNRWDFTYLLSLLFEQRIFESTYWLLDLRIIQGFANAATSSSDISALFFDIQGSACVGFDF